jgi:hypothetical protein
VLGDRTIRREQPLRVSWRLEALQAPLALAGRLVRVLGAVVQTAVLALFHPGQALAHGRPVASQPIRHDHPWHVRQPLEQLTEERLRPLLVAPASHENIEHVADLIDGPLQVMALAVERQKDLIQVPLVPRSGALPPELIGVLLAKFPAPPADRLIRHGDPAFEQQLFHTTIAEAEPEI